MRKYIVIMGLATACLAQPSYAEESLTNGFKDCAALETEYQVGFYSSRDFTGSKLIVEVKNGRWFNLARQKGRTTQITSGKANKWVQVNKHTRDKGSLSRTFFVQSQAFPESADVWDRLADDANRRFVSEKNWSIKCRYNWVAAQSRGDNRSGGGRSEQTLKNFSCSDTRESPHTFFGEGWFDVPAKSSGALCNVIKEGSGKVLRVRIKFDPRV